ncbi:hypothetical protein N7505_008326 [Penicillium chrysogenum]|uniref:Uncharacterized protein n=1 Tax=Penicillium chrysogenum TaxID=5076 RepID=A0ABQ8WCV5_PENCH|nr:hypothetical protein N7505_008326 [Penicillium chrysogenum]
MTPVQVMPHVGTSGPRVLELLYQGVSAPRSLGKSRGHLGRSVSLHNKGSSTGAHLGSFTRGGKSGKTEGPKRKETAKK